MEPILKIWEFICERKKWWLFPVILILFVVAFFIVFAGGTAVAPFIYTLF